MRCVELGSNVLLCQISAKLSSGPVRSLMHELTLLRERLVRP